MSNTTSPNVEFNFTPATFGSQEVVFRTGQALPMQEPRQVDISGVITSAQDYWSLRKAGHQKESCYVIYSNSALFLRLICDEKSKYGTSIKGELEINPDLDDLAINKQAETTLTELARQLKFCRAFFKEVDAYTRLLSNLQKVKTSVQAQIEQEISSRGNKVDNYSVNVTTDLDISFTLSMPLFKGQKITDFKVEICFEVRDRNISVWLDSVELRDAQRAQAEELIKKEVDYFKAEGLVTIEV